MAPHHSRLRLAAGGTDPADSPRAPGELQQQLRVPAWPPHPPRPYARLHRPEQRPAPQPLLVHLQRLREPLHPPPGRRRPRRGGDQVLHPVPDQPRQVEGALADHRVRPHGQPRHPFTREHLALPERSVQQPVLGRRRQQLLAGRERRVDERPPPPRRPRTHRLGLPARSARPPSRTRARPAVPPTAAAASPPPPAAPWPPAATAPTHPVQPLQQQHPFTHRPRPAAVRRPARPTG